MGSWAPPRGGGPESQGGGGGDFPPAAKRVVKLHTACVGVWVAGSFVLAFNTHLLPLQLVLSFGWISTVLYCVNWPPQIYANWRRKNGNVGGRAVVPVSAIVALNQ